MAGLGGAPALMAPGKHLSPTCPGQGPPSRPPKNPEVEQRCPTAQGRKAGRAPHRDG